ncbi:TRAP transporter small permease [Pikeienuella piscinae]|uniref:TRAP transporter small permease protein n=1 Tax=Pikeienuella piscinae TaxID=2748098 RepID=A0A7L5BTX5_9RHOB|nr:TRAP transporter small permease [Pikeienuella piscinae]QIE55620.1 TRAP transporter small permease [Pikeienuella piscinae]
MSDSGPEIHEGESTRGTADHTRVSISIERSLAAAAMAAICFISFANVVVRYATNVSFAFTEEFSVFLLVLLTFIGGSLAFATNENIRIGFVPEHLSPRWKRACDVAALLASMLMFALVLRYSAELSWDEYRFEETSPGLGYPNWIYTIWLPILSVAIIARLMGRLNALLRGRL